MQTKTCNSYAREELELEVDEEWHGVLEGEEGIGKQEEMTLSLNALECSEGGATVRILGQYKNR